MIIINRDKHPKFKWLLDGESVLSEIKWIFRRIFIGEAIRQLKFIGFLGDKS